MKTRNLPFIVDSQKAKKISFSQRHSFTKILEGFTKLHEILFYTKTLVISAEFTARSEVYKNV